MLKGQHFTTVILVGAALVCGAHTASAGATAEAQCQKGRYFAAAKYAQCQMKLIGKVVGGSLFTDVFGGGGELEPFEAAASKCRVKYTDAWAKLQAKASGTGSACDNPRYEDNGDGTVTDRLTGLQWEQKTADATVHDKDTVYSWSATPPFTAADGTAFTSFLATLNGGGCFAGQCDWRLPTIYELQTILLQPYPCTTSPCIDQTVFGPTIDNGYWSGTTGAGSPDFAGDVLFINGGVYYNIYKALDRYVRAVRGGL